MKIVRLLTAAILLSLILIGCVDETQSGNAVSFYYCATESNFSSEMGLFSVEERYVPYNPTEYKMLIEEYLKGAKSTNCTSPFPGGTTLMDFTLRDGIATILFSPHMALQSQADVITCCTCLCKTLFALPDIDTITIAVDGAELNGEKELTFQKDSFVVFDDMSGSITANP